MTLNLSKQQQERIGMIILGTVVLIVVLWYFGVMVKQDQLRRTRDNTRTVLKTLKDAEAEMSKGSDIAAKLEARSQVLAKREAILAPDRDAYSWIMTGVINPFIQARKGVNIYSVSQPDIAEDGLILHFPYKWATFHLKGTGYYYEFGRFFADLENSFPYFRVQNVEISANAGPGVEAEKLAYSFDIVAPVVPSDTK
jgi:Tfp pilus assembly protein PilO